MREELAKIKGVRKRFCGKFQKYGRKKNWHGFSEKTICLQGITDRTGKLFADHIWCNLTKTFEALGELKAGDIVSFEATVTPYTKGYVNMHEGIDKRTTDYRLSRPTKLSKMNPKDITLFSQQLSL